MVHLLRQWIRGERDKEPTGTAAGAIPMSTTPTTAPYADILSVQDVIDALAGRNHENDVERRAQGGIE